jgi:HK97 family phage prohead protease
MSKKPEYRMMHDLEIRGADDEKKMIVGYAAVFNSRSEPLGGFVEKIAPGAFKKSIKEDDVRALVNHDPGKVLGRNTAGTLSLKEDDKGLRYEIDPPETTSARDVMESLRRGDVDQSSFGFFVTDERWEKDGDTTIRTLLGVKLIDVSIVTYPAYGKTSASVRALWPDGKPEHIETAIAALDGEPAGEAPKGSEMERDYLLAKTRIREIEIEE